MGDFIGVDGGAGRAVGAGENSEGGLGGESMEI